MNWAWLLIALFFIFQPHLRAQSVDKGNIYIGAIGGWSNFDHFGFYVFLIPRFEYLVHNKISIGSDLGFNYYYLEFDEPRKFGAIVVNPFARYYFLNKKVSPIVEASYYHAFNFENVSSERTDTNIVFFSFGISTPRLLFNRVGFDLTTGFASDYYHGRFYRIRFAPITSLRITYSVRNK